MRLHQGNGAGVAARRILVIAAIALLPFLPGPFIRKLRAQETPAASTNFPPVVVETAPSKPVKKTKSAKAKSSAPVQASAPSPAPGASTKSAAERETGTSPVPGFVAKISGTGTKTDTPLIETPQAVSSSAATRSNSRLPIASSRRCSTPPGSPLILAPPSPASTSSPRAAST